MLKIGTKLIQLREKHGFTQEMVADKIGMSQGNYSKLETDRYASVSGETLMLLAEIYGINVPELIENSNVQHINLSKNKDNAINAFIVLQETKKQNEQIVEAFRETITSQKETIASQKEMLNAKDAVIHSTNEANTSLKVQNEALLAEVERLKGRELENAK